VTLFPYTTLFRSCWLALTATAASGQAEPAAGGKDATVRAPDFDWIRHTESTLAELKVKLKLEPGQMHAWDVWSDGVIKDAQKQLSGNSPPEATGDQPAGSYDDTTPAQMARGIAHLRAHTRWMQEHLVDLEAALARTSAFYELLDAKQKTIFDLYWHEVRHRVGGDGAHWGMRGPMHGWDGNERMWPHESDYSGSMMQHHTDPMSGY
jgi:hypothetical protein